MSDIKILIVVKDSEAGDAYAHAVTEIGVACDVARSFVEMSQMATDNRYNGFLVDILTLVRCSKEEKVIAYECINLFPVLRVKWEARHKKIKLSPLEQSFSPDTDSALRFFIENRCRNFPARSLRRSPRRSINLNLYYSTDPGFPPDNTYKSFTINLGSHGLFLHTMQDFLQGDTIWIRFLEFADQTPMRATVRWSQPWGVTRCIPGAGVMFETLTKKQEQELAKLLDL
ncbi:PilZ domain-containing protein [Geomonas anaerohicana]|uniref:PilZ domain-containing protein n=1 Tax=Geomonas anaerohicana TaxID=2798583 RepID=A0ABS0YF33_9BACT|nr:PilZ domain-containing protein [Geomonas anaerohicana]MBJ6750916.1 PilZ domain-containing protein [Geomonas anaerohicana]